MYTEICREFRAMNTDVIALVVAETSQSAVATAALARVEALFAKVEAALSRFRPTSELSTLNRSAGQRFAASPLLFEAVDRAVRAARETAGVFDPTVLGALVAAGYDRSFELLATSSAAAAPSPRPSAGTWREIELDRRHQTIRLPAGCGIDLGGIGKGWTVDRATELLSGFAGFAIDAGGDIFAGGTQKDGSPWSVGVADPDHPERDLLSFVVRDAAVATSSTARRRWQQAGRPQHHLIDPRTGQPAQSGVVSATVLAESVARAEVLAKVALILGPEDGLELLNSQPGATGLLVLPGGKTLLSNTLRTGSEPARTGGSPWPGEPTPPIQEARYVV